ncbi:MAG: DUF1570 domain-containing protein [Phycisphaera sp.]|nr:DUF1570 domain-containing protein [Phycisphaera sp.]
MKSRCIAVVCGVWIAVFFCGVGPVHAQQLTQFKSRRYLVITDLDREAAVPWATHMDSVADEYYRRFRGFKAINNEVPSLYLFKTEKGYHDFLSKLGIPSQNSGGMFAVRENFAGLLTFIEGKSRSETLRTLQHEGFHQFAWARIGQDLPTWVNEGLAQYFEDGILVRGSFSVGYADSRRLLLIQDALKNKREVGFDRLLNITGQQWARELNTDADKGALNYAQAWSVVYFLVHGQNKKYQPYFEKYLHFVGEGQSSEEAFKKAFGSNDTDPFRKRWVEYIESLEPDALTTARYRMEFLARAMQFMADQKRPMPQTLDDLRTVLKRSHFEMTYTANGMTIVIKAEDDSLYQYTLPNGSTREFQFLAPERDGDPPRITAQGLKPEPTLVWSRDEEGNLQSDVTYR